MKFLCAGCLTGKGKSMAGRKPLLDEKTISRIRAALEAGARCGDVARRFGITPPTLRRYINGTQREKKRVVNSASPWRAWVHYGK
jgi:transposase-like protein